MELNITFDQLEGVANDLDRKTDEFQTNLNDIKRINAELRDSWQGSDATSYTNAVETQAQVMQNLHDTIVEISQFLRTVSQKYQEVMENNKVTGN